MTDNQAIDGAPRELLPCPFCGSDKVSLAWDVYDTDRGRRTQSQITCLGCRLLTKTFKSHAEARTYWNNRATQPQGEPVARIDGMYGDPEAFAEREIRALCDVNKLKIGTLLYAEQPAPVAVVPDGFLLVERGIWTEDQVASAAKCITMLKGVPGMTDRDLAMAAMDAGQCRVPEILPAPVAEQLIERLAQRFPDLENMYTAEVFADWLRAELNPSL